MATDQGLHHHSDTYNFNHGHRGTCLIISMERFSPEAYQSPFSWAHYDLDRMESTFKTLGFKTITMQSRYATTTAVLRKLADIAAEDHSNEDCFVCAISTHGSEELCPKGFSNQYLATKDQLAFYDGHLKVEQLLEPLSNKNCPSLRGKPKLFFIQACRIYFEPDPDCPDFVNKVDKKMFGIAVPPQEDFRVQEKVPGESMDRITTVETNLLRSSTKDEDIITTTITDERLDGVQIPVSKSVKNITREWMSCRRDKGEMVVKVKTKITEDGRILSVTSQEERYAISMDVPLEEDFLLAYPVPPGYTAFMYKNVGSLFLLYLCNMLIKYYKKTDLLSILDRVANQVAVDDRDDFGEKNMPCIISMLTKNLYFNSSSQDDTDAVEEPQPIPSQPVGDIDEVLTDTADLVKSVLQLARQTDTTPTQLVDLTERIDGHKMNLIMSVGKLRPSLSLPMQVTLRNHQMQLANGMKQLWEEVRQAVDLDNQESYRKVILQIALHLAKVSRSLNRVVEKLNLNIDAKKVSMSMSHVDKTTETHTGPSREEMGGGAKATGSIPLGEESVENMDIIIEELEGCVPDETNDDCSTSESVEPKDPSNGTEHFDETDSKKSAH